MEIENPILNDSLLGIICAIRDGIFPLFMAMAVIAFIVAAYYFLTSNADPGRIKRAKQALLFSVVGVVLALFAFGLPTIIFELFGADVSTAC